MSPVTRPNELFDLRDRVALVTGGSKGIGRAIADALAGAGASVAILVKDDVDTAERGVAEIREHGVDSFWVQADIARADQVRDAVKLVEDRLGGVDILVNNAGTSIREPAETFSGAAWETVIGTNLTGSFLCAQSVFPSMARRGRGSIINIASMAGVVGISGTAAYSVSKGGLVQMTRALAIEWAPTGVRVNAISPCPVDTELSRRVFADRPEVLEALIRDIPVGRIARPEDLQGAAVFLASDASAMVTGAVLAVDGGWTAK